MKYALKLIGNSSNPSYISAAKPEGFEYTSIIERAQVFCSIGDVLNAIAERARQQNYSNFGGLTIVGIRDIMPLATIRQEIKLDDGFDSEKKPCA